MPKDKTKWRAAIGINCWELIRTNRQTGVPEEVRFQGSCRSGQAGPEWPEGKIKTVGTALPTVVKR